MVIHLQINGQPRDFAVQPHETLLTALRRAGYFSVKHGCETGECGACSVIMRQGPDQPAMVVNACVTLAAQAQGAEIITVEALGDRRGLSVLQQCFAENGAIQCGYCTPAQILAAKVLLDRTLNPSEAEVREAIGGVLCRCTGYLKPVQAVLNAAACLRGERPDDLPPAFLRVLAPEGSTSGAGAFRQDIGDVRWGGEGPGTATQIETRVQTLTLAPFMLAPEPQTSVVGKPEQKVDAAKLAQGKPAFVDDAPMPGMLYAAMLTSPHAHARIKHIDTSKAKALPGVHAVLTYKDVPRVVYASGGQSYPNPLPLRPGEPR